MMRSTEEAGFHFADVGDFYNKIQDDLRNSEVYSMWRNIDGDRPDEAQDGISNGDPF